ncbi:MAG: hypothetical protein P9M00_11415 [Candidatus Tritonobacter lacicola]|nr:hypothetical protein [Candidatus Tritonobacter lacicola]
MEDKKKGLELEIVAPAQAKPGEDIVLELRVKSITGRGYIKRLELIATIERSAENYAQEYLGARFYTHWPLGLFPGCKKPIAEYFYQGETSRRPVSRIVLARDIDLMIFTESTYNVTLRLQGSGDTGIPFLWKLTLAARVPFAQDPLAVTYIRPII